MVYTRHGNIHDTYKDDWNSEDENLLAEVLISTSLLKASSKGEVCCCIYNLHPLLFNAYFTEIRLFLVFRWLVTT